MKAAMMSKTRRASPAIPRKRTVEESTLEVPK
jgi:hypothetical protein